MIMSILNNMAMTGGEAEKSIYYIQSVKIIIEEDYDGYYYYWRNDVWQYEREEMTNMKEKRKLIEIVMMTCNDMTWLMTDDWPTVWHYRVL